MGGVSASRIGCSLHCCVVSLDKKTLHLVVFLRPGVKMGTGDILLGVTLR